MNKLIKKIQKDITQTRQFGSNFKFTYRTLVILMGLDKYKQYIDKLVVIIDYPRLHIMIIPKCNLLIELGLKDLILKKICFILETGLNTVGPWTDTEPYGYKWSLPIFNHYKEDNNLNIFIVSNNMIQKRYIYYNNDPKTIFDGKI